MSEKLRRLELAVEVMEARSSLDVLIDGWEADGSQTMMAATGRTHDELSSVRAHIYAARAQLDAMFQEIVAKSKEGQDG